mgnify:CR=1 FL=1
MKLKKTKAAAAHAQIRLGNHEIARIMGGKRMREEFAEQAARAADTELRTVWDNISTGEREVIEADYRAIQIEKLEAALYGKEGDFINYVKGANIAGFIKVADSMIEQGLV